MKRKRKPRWRIAPMSKLERDAVRRALRKPPPEVQRDREMEMRISISEGEYERAMVAAALRVAAGRAE
jgi:hypothetical protein